MDEFVGSSVQRKMRENLIALAERAHHQCGDGGHARGMQNTFCFQIQSVCFEQCDLFFCFGYRRIAPSCIDISGLLSGKAMHALLRTIKHVGAAGINGSQVRMRGIGSVSSVNGNGSPAFCRCCFFHRAKLLLFGVVGPFNPNGTPCKSSSEGCQNNVISFFEFGFPLPQT